MARIVDGTIVFDDGTPMMGQQPISGKRLIEVLQLLPQLIPAIGMAGFPTRGGGAGGFVASGGGGGGNQGTPAAGTPGATGTSGYSGYSGSSTGTSGFSGYSGSGGPGASGFSGYSGVGGPGASGFSGYSGVGGPGTSGFSGYSGAGGTFTPEAATYVVHPTPGVGDFTTIQAALTALPAEGGFILVREGTYSISTTNTLPVGKPVTIRGCGNSTVISLGANAIPAFTIPTGAATNTPIVFDNFLVTGTEVAAQAVLEYADSNGLVEVYMENLVTTGIQFTVNITASSSESATPGKDSARFHLLRCRIRPITTNNSIILRNPSSGVPRVWMTEVEFIGDSLFAVPGGHTGPLFGRIIDDNFFGDVYLDGCEMSVGGAGAAGESDFSVFEAVNTIIWNNDTVNHLVNFFTFGSSTGFGPGTLSGSTFKGIHFQVIEGNVFEGCQFTDCVIDNFGVGTVISDNDFLQSISPYVSTYVIKTQDENAVIHGNRFKITTPPDQVVQCEVSTTITDNDWSGINNPGTNGVLYLNNAVSCIVVGNRFPFVPTSGPPLKEVSGSNYYHANSQLWNSGGGGSLQPVVPIGGASEVEGMLDMSGTVGTGGGPIDVVNYRNPFGLAQVKGYVENTGANNYTLTETWVTQNLGTFTRVTTPVTPGTKTTLDPFDLTGTGLAPNSYQVIQYRVSIAVIAGAIAAHKYFAAPSGVSNA